MTEDDADALLRQANEQDSPEDGIFSMEQNENLMSPEQEMDIDYMIEDQNPINSHLSSGEIKSNTNVQQDPIDILRLAQEQSNGEVPDVQLDSTTNTQQDPIDILRSAQEQSNGEVPDVQLQSSRRQCRSGRIPEAPQDTDHTVEDQNSINAYPPSSELDSTTNAQQDPIGILRAAQEQENDVIPENVDLNPVHEQGQDPYKPEAEAMQESDDHSMKQLENLLNIVDDTTTQIANNNDISVEQQAAPELSQENHTDQVDDIDQPDGEPDNEDIILGQALLHESGEQANSLEHVEAADVDQLADETGTLDTYVYNKIIPEMILLK